MQSEMRITERRGARRAPAALSPPVPSLTRRNGPAPLAHRDTQPGHSASGVLWRVAPAVEGQGLCAASWEGTVSRTFSGGWPQPGLVFGTLLVSPVVEGWGAGVPGLLGTQFLVQAPGLLVRSLGGPHLDVYFLAGERTYR